MKNQDQTAKSIMIKVLYSQKRWSQKKQQSKNNHYQSFKTPFCSLKSLGRQKKETRQKELNNKSFKTHPLLHMCVIKSWSQQKVLLFPHSVIDSVIED